MKVWLVDFDDSFTFNIASELWLLRCEVQVISWRKWVKSIPGEADMVILGPGPGHPDEYPLEEAMLRFWKSETKFAGICLGHQIMARFLGLPVRSARVPMHGQKLKLDVPSSFQATGLPAKVVVQRYNSLAVEGKRLPKGWSGWDHDGEWMALRHERALTYQFHPESVGTSCPAKLLAPMLNLVL